MSALLEPQSQHFCHILCIQSEFRNTSYGFLKLEKVKKCYVCTGDRIIIPGQAYKMMLCVNLLHYQACLLLVINICDQQQVTEQIACFTAFLGYFPNMRYYVYIWKNSGFWTKNMASSWNMMGISVLSFAIESFHVIKHLWKETSHKKIIFSCF